jgi:oligopeptide/dipeptide ABC transporter ATP-binding protein
MTAAASDNLLEVRDLRITLHTDDGPAQVLNRVSLTVRRGEILGLVGESGCGKSTLVRALLGIFPRSAVIESGQILFQGVDLLKLGQAEMTRNYRASRIGFIPQDPYLALNPTFRVGSQFLETMRWHAPDRNDGRSARERRAGHRAKLIELMRAVQIPDAESAMERYPHQFSGGQRQRLMIAAALACGPDLLVADEPTSALDVTIQREILLLLKRLAQQFDFSTLFVTHDFGVVAQLCDRVSVMYAGQSVEDGDTDEVLTSPRHPYTIALLNCHPDRGGGLAGIPGSVSSPLAPPPGCRFHPRCTLAEDRCRLAFPPAVELNSAQSVCCVRYAHRGEAMELPSAR